MLKLFLYIFFLLGPAFLWSQELAFVSSVNLLSSQSANSSLLVSSSSAVQILNSSSNTISENSFDSTGVLAIDTLKNYEWDIPFKEQKLESALLWSAVPGGVQYYTGHKVRAGFIFAIEAYLVSEVFFNSSMRADKYQESSQKWASKSAPWLDSLISHPLSPWADIWRDSLKQNIRQMRLQADLAEENRGLLKSEQAWLLGMQVYSMMDGLGIYLHNQRRLSEKREASSAVWRAIVLPGWGQIYNDDYGKAGLLWMSFIGSAVSFQARQHTVEYYLGRYHTALAENNSSEASLMSEKVLFFRKKRNQYIWAPFLFYMYSIGDAAVDALLGDFDPPQKVALHPVVDGLELEYSWRF